MPFEHPHLMPQMVAKRASDGDDVALKHVDGSVLNWQSAYDDSLRWAGALERHGARIGHPVVTLFANSFDSFRAWQGCGWLRAIEAPVNTNYKGDWLRHVVNNTEAELVLADARYVGPLLDISDQLPHVRKVIIFGEMPQPATDLPFELLGSDEFLDGATVRERPEPGPWDVSALIYTSGTTGRSKAVMVPWGQFYSSMESGLFPIDRLEGLRTYSPYPQFHVTGKGGFYNAAAFGGYTVIREAFSSVDYWEDVRAGNANAGILLGPLAHMLLGRDEAADDARNPMEMIVMAPVIPEVDAFCRRFGLEVFTTYNMTEINCPIVRPHERCTSNNFSSCGQVRDGVEVRIVDEHDRQVPPNTPGEMIVRGEPWELNTGYWNMPEKTNEAWRNGWFHTGDAFTYDEDGNYYFVDRAKDYIRRRGENISSFEIEAIVNQHPAITESGAAAVPAAEGEDEVKIAVVLAQNADFDPAELIDFLIPRMPRFAIPRYIEIWESLPKTEATARIQKAKIRESGVSEKTWDRVAAGIVIPR